MSGPLILLPPSEGKAPGGTGAAHPWGDGPLGAQRVAVRKALVAAMRADEAARGKLLGVKGEALAAATVANRAITDAPTLPAIERYTGVLYDALDVATLPAAHRRRLGRQVLILSGLWGAVSPDEPIPDYKLKMGAALPKLGVPARHWRPHLTGLLVDRAGRRPVWDLLPNEHAAAWSPPKDLRRITVRFVDVGADGREKTVSHWNKLLKGAVVRWVLATGAEDVAALEQFDHPLGYRFLPERTAVEGGLTTAVLARHGG